MKFVHIADMHFDAPFTMLNNKKDFGDKRRLNQRKIFKEIIEYIKENKISYFFISGDLYENEYVKQSTIEFINNLFKTIIDTKIFISPGNHDPYLKNSYYKTFNWSKNVYIFNSEISKIEFENVNIYGFGFEDFYYNNSQIENIKLDNKNKINILIMHGSLDASDAIELKYNPINSKKLNEIGFDYIALGHIHKALYKNEENPKIIYPGSTVALGFDELDEHGMIIGDIEKNFLKIDFKKLDEKIFEEEYIDISELNIEEDLIEKINELNIQENKIYKIILIGKRKFEINLNKINKLILKNNILKIKDNTQLNYNIEKIAQENNLKGIFVKELLNKLNNGIYEKDIIEKAIEIGLNIL